MILFHIALKAHIQITLLVFFRLETSDGQKRQEHAELRHVGTDRQAIAVRGSYSYIGPDGKEYTINYVADEFGFQPEGEHLPKVLY